MRIGIIGDQFALSVADDLNIYYEQFPCVGTPKIPFHIDRIRLEKRPVKVGAFYEATAELKGFHWRNSFAHGTSIGTPPPDGTFTFSNNWQSECNVNSIFYACRYSFLIFIY